MSIEGKLRWSQWERDGQKRSKIEVIVDELEFMSGRGGSPSCPPSPAVAEASQAVYDEDIPF